MAEPKIRFKKDDGTEYPDCQTLKMADIFTEITDKNHPEMPVLSILQGTGTVLRDEIGRNIGYDKDNLKDYKAMQKGDFIIHLRSFEGGLECSNHNGISSPAYRILRTNKLIPEAYKGYFRTYNFIEGKLANSVVGIRDGKNIDMPTFWDIEMDVPCLEEQQKIASFFTDLDEVITQSEDEIKALEKQKKGVMQKIFSQEVRFKKDDGGEYPEWEEKSFDEIYTSFPNKNFQIQASEYKTNGKYPVIDQGKEFIAGFTDSEEKVCKNVPCIVFGDHTTIIKYINKPFIVGADGVKTLTSVYNVKYSAYLLAANNIKPTGYNRHFSKLKDLMFVTSTDSEEQQKIANFLSSFDEAIDIAKQELVKWKLLKKGLLQQMFV